jgi:uncharacterized protein YggU (UPF0235/DUF167 family)
MYIQVKIQTNAKRESITEIKEHVFSISVKEKPEMNMANTKVREMLAVYLKKSISEIHIISGHKRPQKKVFIGKLHDK